MTETISNEFLTLEVSARGAEMQSVKDAQGRECLWQGDENSWPDKAINLFPWVARLTEGRYTYEGSSYEMESHGFTAASEFAVSKQSETELLFTFRESPATLKKYPFRFVFHIGYRLVGKSIEVSYKVENTGGKTMFFGLGGHPGFIVPMDEGADFSDYTLVFSKAAKPLRVGMSEDCFLTGEDLPYPLEKGTSLPLAQSLFDGDAIILRNMADEVTIKGPSHRKITLSYPGFPYLGLWNWPKKDVNYLCIEPWMSLPARKGKVEALEEKSDLIRLPAGKAFSCGFTITL